MTIVDVPDAAVKAMSDELKRWTDGFTSRGPKSKFTVYREDDSGEFVEISGHATRAAMEEALKESSFRAALAAALPHLSTSIHDTGLEEAARAANKAIALCLSEGGILTEAGAPWWDAIIAAQKKLGYALKVKSIPSGTGELISRLQRCLDHPGFGRANGETAAIADALDAKDALLREAREDVGLLVRQLTAMANNAERLGQPIWHSSSPVAEQIAKVDFLLSKLTEATKP